MSHATFLYTYMYLHIYICMCVCICIYIYICVYKNVAFDICCFNWFVLSTNLISFFIYSVFWFFVSHIFLFVCCLCLRVLHVTFLASNWFVLSTNLISFFNVYESIFFLLFMSLFFCFLFSYIFLFVCCFCLWMLHVALFCIQLIRIKYESLFFLLVLFFICIYIYI